MLLRLKKSMTLLAVDLSPPAEGPIIEALWFLLFSVVSVWWTTEGIEGGTVADSSFEDGVTDTLESLWRDVFDPLFV